MGLKNEIPAGFAAEMRRIDGLDAESLLNALDTDASVSIRLNRYKTMGSQEALYPDMTPVEWCRSGFYLPERPVFTLNPLLHAGVFYVQDASSMIYQQILEKVCRLMPDDRSPLTLLDFCAAPGGKTTAMINALPEGSVVVANEFVPARGKILRENLEKWGYPGVITTGSASSDYSVLPELFDIVAVDAPCSGEGMMRKDETARSQWSEELVGQCAALQKEILADIVNVLRPGGYLIYSTCTFNLEEDEKNSRFIRNDLGLGQVGLADLKGISDTHPALLPDVEGLRFMPHLTSGEGLYISIFRKPGTFIPYLEETVLNRPSEAKLRHKSQRKGKSSDSFSSLNDQLLPWFTSQWDMQFEENGSLVTAIPKNALPILETLRNAKIRITGAGLPVAENKGRDIIPDSRVALSIALDKSRFPSIELSEEEALKYLRRDTLSFSPDTPKGYVIVTFKGHPLGMMKNIGNRANNLLPQAWRIRI